MPVIFDDMKRDKLRAFSKFVGDRSVVLVGPARSLIGRSLGKWIDGHDLVVRMNLSCPLDPSRVTDLGARTDILYHRLLDQRLAGFVEDHSPEQTATWKAAGVKWLVTSQNARHARVQRYLKLVGEMVPVLCMDAAFKRMVCRNVKSSSPSLGTYAICHLLQREILSLDVTGYDWYASTYYPSYGGFTDEQAARGTGAGFWGQNQELPNANPHPQTLQKEYLARLRESEPRLRFDGIAEKILSEI